MIEAKFKKDTRWVEKVIKSCKTQEQLNVAAQCVCQFKKKWENQPVFDNFGSFFNLFSKYDRLKTLVLRTRTNILKKNVDIYSKN